MSNAERRELPTNRRDIDKIVAWSVLRAARKLDRSPNWRAASTSDPRA